MTVLEVLNARRWAMEREANVRVSFSSSSLRVAPASKGGKDVPEPAARRDLVESMVGDEVKEEGRSVDLDSRGRTSARHMAACLPLAPARLRTGPEEYDDDKNVLSKDVANAISYGNRRGVVK